MLYFIVELPVPIPLRTIQMTGSGQTVVLHHSPTQPPVNHAWLCWFVCIIVYWIMLGITDAILIYNDIQIWIIAAHRVWWHTPALLYVWHQPLKSATDLSQIKKPHQYRMISIFRKLCILVTIILTFEHMIDICPYEKACQIQEDARRHSFVFHKQS